MGEIMGEIAKALTLLCCALAAIWSKNAKKEAAQANDAVNHRHVDGTPRLYDLALRNDERTDELIEWKRSYEGGPLDTGEKVENFMQEFRDLKGRCPECPEDLKEEEDDEET